MLEYYYTYSRIHIIVIKLKMSLTWILCRCTGFLLCLPLELSILKSATLLRHVLRAEKCVRKLCTYLYITASVKLYLFFTFLYSRYSFRDIHGVVVYEVWRIPWYHTDITTGASKNIFVVLQLRSRFTLVRMLVVERGHESARNKRISLIY